MYVLIGLMAWCVIVAVVSFWMGLRKSNTGGKVERPKPWPHWKDDS